MKDGLKLSHGQGDDLNLDGHETLFEWQKDVPSGNLT